MRQLALILLLAWRVQAQESPCATAEQAVPAALSSSVLAKDANGAIRQAFLLAAEALPRCRQSEQLWYATARAAELNLAVFPMDLGTSQLKDFTGLLQEALRQCPKSARLATIQARKIGTIEAARLAISLDPTYGPAGAALGAARLAGGDARAAIATLAALKDLNRIPGGCVLLARAYGSDGDTA